jgi:hypothetical protein
MATIAKTLVQSQFAAMAETNQYVAGTGTRTYIDAVTATNVSAANATLTISLVPAAGAAGAANRMVVKTLAQNESYRFPEIIGQVLSAGDFISTSASAASAITLRISGREMTV